MPSSRKPGGQKANKNALKHGIYSHFITLGDDVQMIPMSDRDNTDELAQARVAFTHCWEAKLAATDVKDKLAWDLAAHSWFESIVAIKTNNANRKEQGEKVWDTLMEAMRAANDRQGFKR